MSKALEQKNSLALPREKTVLDLLSGLAENWTPEQVLYWAYENYWPDIAVASAFGAEGIALIDMAANTWPRLRVFVVDTSFLFPETYKLIEQVEDRYGIEVERLLPALTPSEQDRAHGLELWTGDPDLCCQIRKVEPLRRKLTQLRAWVTAIRGDQTPARANTNKVECEPHSQVVKINPLADWTHDMIWSYIRTKQLPYNPLHDCNFPSIGCTHCTRAIKAGEDPRAGRWPTFEKLECGMHTFERISKQKNAQ